MFSRWFEYGLCPWDSRVIIPRGAIMPGEKRIKGSVREKLLSFGISWSCCLVTHSMGLLYYLVLVFTLFSLAGLSIQPAAQKFPLILLYFLDLQMASSGL